MKESQTSRICRILNEALDADVAAVTALVSHRVPTNAALREHRTILTRADDTTNFLGLINGATVRAAPYSSKGDRPIIAANYDDNGVLVRFSVLE